MNQRKKDSIFIGAAAAVFYLPFLGGVNLFDWDEINFAEIAREMLVLGDWFRIHMDFMPFAEKPPLFFWLQALSMKVLGVGEYAARLPNAICGIVTLVVLYQFGSKLKDRRMGWLWAGTYFGSVLPALYFKSGIIDPWFNLFIFLSLWYIFREATDRQNRLWNIVLAGLFCGLAVLTKGPVAVLIIGTVLIVRSVSNGWRWIISPLKLLALFALGLFITATWFGMEWLTHGPKYVIDFTVRQWELFSTPDAGHGGFPGYHFVVLFLGCFPASIFAVRALDMKSGPTQSEQFVRWMINLLWIVLILFSIVQSKIVHYSSLAYFPITFLAAHVIGLLWDGKIALSRWMKISLYVVSGIASIAVIVLPLLALNVKQFLSLFEKDKFAMANLQADVFWTGLEGVSALFLLGGTLGFIYLTRKSKWKKSLVFLFGGTSLFVSITLMLFIGKIEAYSQRAAIEFFESKKDCDCYLATEKYKSYAPYFYGEVKKDRSWNRFHHDWLKKGDIDKEVFFVSRINGTKDLELQGDIKRIGEKNGFVFWHRPLPRQ